MKALPRTGRDEKRTIARFFIRKIDFCNWDDNGNLLEKNRGNKDEKTNNLPITFYFLVFCI
jgi:hypothetical protein